MNGVLSFDYAPQGEHRRRLTREIERAFQAPEVVESFRRLAPGLRASLLEPRRLLLTWRHPRERPLAELIREHAPAEWQVEVGKPPQPLADCISTHDVADARARVGFTRGHLMEIVVFAPAVVGWAEKEAEAHAYDVSADLLGSVVFERWVGAVGAGLAPRRGSLRLAGRYADYDDALPIAQLAETVDRAASAVVAGLPERPFFERHQELGWVGFEVEPLDELGPPERVLASTCAPELLKCWLEQEPFSSERFSRAGEHFGQLVIPHAGAGLSAAVARRDALEQRLNERLVAERVGCVIGSGVGPAQTFLDLALGARERALPIVQDLVRDVGVEGVSYQPFDDALQDERIPLG